MHQPSKIGWSLHAAAVRFLIGLLIATCAVAANAQAQPPALAPSVSLDAARKALQNASAVVIDIREPSEHATGIAQGVRLLPMSQLSKRIGEVPKTSQQPVLLICNTQNRSARVAEQLRAAGYTNISYVNGGMSQWARLNWPMVAP